MSLSSLNPDSLNCVAGFLDRHDRISLKSTDLNCNIYVILDSIDLFLVSSRRESMVLEKEKQRMFSLYSIETRMQRQFFMRFIPRFLKERILHDIHISIRLQTRRVDFLQTNFSQTRAVQQLAGIRESF